jgi:hypothetical protein
VNRVGEGNLARHDLPRSRSRRLAHASQPSTAASGAAVMTIPSRSACMTPFLSLGH